MSHVPVMAGEVLDLIGAAPGQQLVDLTVGAGGHASAFLECTGPDGRVLASDRDAEALALAEVNLAPFNARVRFRQGDSVSALSAWLREGVRADAVLLDLGVSSMQLDEIDRGFSLREDGPLDMRMDAGADRTAADLVNRASVDELDRILRELGDERASTRIARAIVERRASRPFRTTGDLRTVIEQALRRRGGRTHPATRTFQALRMEVNRELPLLVETLPLALSVLRPGGVLAVIAFHSGEDRLVKEAFAAWDADERGRVLTPRPLSPSHAEQRRNRRSRSARLRGFRKAGGEA